MYEIDIGSTEGKQLDLCKDKIAFVYREKREMELEVFCVSNTWATASAAKCPGFSFMIIRS